MANYASTAAFQRSTEIPLCNREGKIVGTRIYVTTFYPTCPGNSCSDTTHIDHTFVEGDDYYECDCA